MRLLPFFGMPMIISPLAGALSDKTGRRPVMVTGLALLSGGFLRVVSRPKASRQLTGTYIGAAIAEWDAIGRVRGPRRRT